MRAEKGVDLLRLARALTATGEGVSMEALCGEFGVGRRTIERRMAAIEGMFGPVEREDGDGRTKLYRLPGGAGDRLLTRLDARELAELEHAIAAAEASDIDARADLLRSLHGKLRASMRLTERTRLDSDLEGLMEHEMLACRPGPRARVPSDTIETLRTAMLSGRLVGFRYANRAEPTAMVPWGLVFGLRSYLVGAYPDTTAPHMYRLDRMADVAVLEAKGTRPARFDLAAYAARSFGTFQEEPQRVVLRFAADVAADARAFLFHPTQEVAENGDGSLTVSFTAGGFRQIAHHLFTWGRKVRIVEPEVLRDEMRHCLAEAALAVEPD